MFDDLVCMFFIFNEVGMIYVTSLEVCRLSPIYFAWWVWAVPVPEKAALVSCVDAAVIEPVQKPGEGVLSGNVVGLKLN